MQVALIAPFSLLDKTQDQSFHMILQQFTSRGKYFDFYSKVKGYKILDNGAAEGSLMKDVRGLIDLALALKADEIVLPDVMGDKEASEELLLSFENVDKHDLKFMAVAHGQNLTEFLSYIRFISQLDFVDVIGLPRLIGDQLFPTARLLGALVANEYGKPVHCLGANHWIREVEWLSASNKVRSMDTSLPFVLGMRQIACYNGSYVNRQPNYFFADDFSSESLQVIDDNIEQYLQWASAPFGRLSKLSA